MTRVRPLLLGLSALLFDACAPGNGTADAGAHDDAGSKGPTVALTSHVAMVAKGGGTSLSWSSSGAGDCTASGAWSGSRPGSGSEVIADIAATSTYTLTCRNGAASAGDSVTIEVPASAPADSSCTSSSGPLHLDARASRASGIAPLLVFLDATATRDTAIDAGMTEFQDVFYSWSFGDAGPSGTATWAQGAHPGHNSRNAASGGIAAHLYATSGADARYVATVTARDGTNIASCQLSVTAFDAAGARGFPAKRTTCVSSSAMPSPGAGGCPVGAAVARAASFNAALSSHFGAGRRVLFKCGDIFTGDGAALNAVGWSVGAYGGCEGGKSNRPVFRDPDKDGALVIGYDAGDGRISDIDFEGDGTGAAAVTTLGGNSRINHQITLFNLRSNGNDASFAWSQGAQWGLVDSEMTGMRASIGTFVNFNENNPATWRGNTINNLDYQAILGNRLDGRGVKNGGGGVETLRISACRLCVISNNTIENANDIGAVLKLHNGNTNNSLPSWTGVYTELIEISDNRFGGTSGAELVDIEPQNAGVDERLRNIVFERNLLTGTTGAEGGNQLRTSVPNETIRNNVFLMNSASPRQYPIYGADVGQLGIDPPVEHVEVFNNTCYIPEPRGQGQACIAFNGFSMHAPPQDSRAQNNLLYAASGEHSTVEEGGLRNEVSHNGDSTRRDPHFTNASGSLRTLEDFRPAAPAGAGTRVPVWSDALGIPWPGMWELGAVRP